MAQSLSSLRELSSNDCHSERPINVILIPACIQSPPQVHVRDPGEINEGKGSVSISCPAAITPYDALPTAYVRQYRSSHFDCRMGCLSASEYSSKPIPRLI